jgi:hypothetical protein
MKRKLFLCIIKKIVLGCYDETASDVRNAELPRGNQEIKYFSWNTL